MPLQITKLSLPAVVNPLPRRLFLAAAASFLLLPAMARAAPLSPQNQALVQRLDAYLNNQSAITAKFMQVNDDGTTRTGKAWMERPGRMRFEYDPPDPQLLVSGGTALVYHDPELNQTTNIPLASTPLGILLAKHVSLDSNETEITNITRQPGEYDITLIRRGKAALGSLTLVFSTNPIELLQWVVTDAQGRQTRVSLYDITPTGPLPASLFQYSISAPVGHRGAE